MVHKTFDNYPVNGTNYTLLEVDLNWNITLTKMPLAMNLSSSPGQQGMEPGA